MMYKVKWFFLLLRVRRYEAASSRVFRRCSSHAETSFEDVAAFLKRPSFREPLLSASVVTAVVADRVWIPAAAASVGVNNGRRCSRTFGMRATPGRIGFSTPTTTVLPRGTVSRATSGRGVSSPSFCFEASMDSTCSALIMRDAFVHCVQSATVSTGVGDRFLTQIAILLYISRRMNETPET